jgi:molybdopterin converting factor subunit 1
MNIINVRYFASLRELAGCSQETLEVDCQTYGQLYSELAVKHSFPLPKNVIQVAVNDQFAKLDTVIEPGATVVFIPPVAGG